VTIVTAAGAGLPPGRVAAGHHQADPVAGGEAMHEGGHRHGDRVDRRRRADRRDQAAGLGDGAVGRDVLDLEEQERTT
jgi:hypothetical protein